MGRRGWSEGSIYRHGDRWRVSVSLGSDAFGKRVRKEWQVRSQASAERKLREVQARLRGGLPAEESRVTVAVYAQEWLRAVKPNVRPSTFDFYRTMAEIHLDEIGHYPLARVSPSDIRGIIAKRFDEGYAPRTVRAILDVLRMMMKMAVQDGILTRNVAELVQRPKLEQAEPKHFTADEARRFLDAAKEDELGSLYAVAIGTGLRRGELLGLTWRDVDGATVRVAKAKTATGVRLVPLPPFAADALSRLDRRPGHIWAVSPSHVSKHFAVLCRRAGVPVLPFHSLRHSAASLMLDAGVDPLTIQQVLGHSRVTMTAHYARAGEDRKREAVDALGRRMAGRSDSEAV